MRKEQLHVIIVRGADETGGASDAPPQTQTRPDRRTRSLVTEDACRIDVWLWRARFFKTRSLAARVVEDGGVRLLRGQARAPVDKPSRPVRCGDVLSFAQGPRWVAVKVEALGERRGIVRYGAAMIPMDETLTRVALDMSNRPYLIWKVGFSKPKLGDMDTELFKEWFQAFAQTAGATLHVENLYGENNHHIVESCFKGLARALREAIAIDPRAAAAVPSTKGSL